MNISTNTGSFAADLLQVQPSATIGSIYDCRLEGLVRGARPGLGGDPPGEADQGMETRVDIQLDRARQPALGRSVQRRSAVTAVVSSRPTGPRFARPEDRLRPGPRLAVDTGLRRYGGKSSWG